MFVLLVAAQLAIALHPAPTYASPALRALVARAAAANRTGPPALRGYDARVESEFALVLHDTLGREQTSQIEQLESAAEWRRPGDYDLHVIGYRLQTTGLPFSTLSIVRGWTEPTLYGDRLSMGMLPAGRARARDTLLAVHPFAVDRDRFYQFAGGDTITVLHTPGREIPIARIRVMPSGFDSSAAILFDGEIDIDATRGDIVRMRGEFVTVGDPNGGRPLWARLSGTVGVAFIDFVNAEVDGRFWLPAYQRTEFQAAVPLVTSSRAVFRLYSHFGDYEVRTGDSTAVGDAKLEHMDVTWAPGDSLNAFNDWSRPLGAVTASVSASDFDDLGPDAWKVTGPPRVDFSPSNSDQVLRYDRVEGPYTGMAFVLRLRSAAPGLSASAFGGWAWAEHTARGGAGVTLDRAPWIASVRAERSLASTNDFAPAFDPGSGDLGALLASADDYDYVDRRRALTSVTHMFGGVKRAFVTVQLGAGDDRNERSRLTRGPFGGPTFRPNRDAQSGSYALAAADAEFNPDIGAEFVQSGVGARLHYEVGRGQLSWQRAELLLAARRYWGPTTLSIDGNAGIVAGRVIPPQQLFELGGDLSLPGYRYKEFAGDRAALLTSVVSYRLPLWARPHRVWRDYVIPGLAPGVSIGVQGGWSELSTPAARAAVNALGAGWSATPVSRATDGARASVSAGLTFFSETIHVGVARAVDHAAPWRLVAGFGRAF